MAYICSVIAVVLIVAIQLVAAVVYVLCYHRTDWCCIIDGW